MARNSDNNDVIFEVRDLKINAVRDDGSELPIVKGVDFKVRRGEVVALIGESGSGKTTISLSALGYCKPGLKFAGGEACLLGQDVTKMSTEELRPVRGEKVAYLAQSAAATFNPSILINEQVTEAPILHGTKTQAEADAKALSLYHALELPDPENIGTRYPHQVSGGQLQRLMAAMALCGEPDLLVLDEPTTALDVTTQIEVLKAFKKVIKEEGAAAIYVTHDQAEALTMSDRMAVMMDGEILQLDTPNEIYKNPSNLRVAEFIGSPKINVLPAESDEKGNITCKGITISQTLKIPKKSNLLLGIRPEHMEIIGKNKKKCLNGKIIHKENLGSDVYLHVVLNENEEKIIVRSDSTNAFEVKIGEEVNTEWNDEKILTFDLDGKSLPLNK